MTIPLAPYRPDVCACHGRTLCPACRSWRGLTPTARPVNPGNGRPPMTLAEAQARLDAHMALTTAALASPALEAWRRKRDTLRQHITRVRKRLARGEGESCTT